MEDKAELFKTRARLIKLFEDFIKSGEQVLEIETEHGTYYWHQSTARQMLNDLLAEQARIEEELKRLKEAEHRLQFLGKQMKLITLIKEAGLVPTDVLANIPWGLTLSVEDLLSLTNEVVQKLIEQLGATLGQDGGLEQ